VCVLVNHTKRKLCVCNTAVSKSMSIYAVKTYAELGESDIVVASISVIAGPSIPTPWSQRLVAFTDQFLFVVRSSASIPLTAPTPA
jgi:hypothetical protein